MNNKLYREEEVLLKCAENARWIMIGNLSAARRKTLIDIKTQLMQIVFEIDSQLWLVNHKQYGD